MIDVGEVNDPPAKGARYGDDGSATGDHGGGGAKAKGAIKVGLTKKRKKEVEHLTADAAQIFAAFHARQVRPAG